MLEIEEGKEVPKELENYIEKDENSKIIYRLPYFVIKEIMEKDEGREVKNLHLLIKNGKKVQKLVIYVFAMERFMVIPPIKANYKFCKRLYEVFTTFFNLCIEAKKLRNNILSNQNIHTIYFYFKNAQAYEKILDLLEANKSTDYSNKIISTAEYIIGRQNFDTPSEKELKQITYYNKGKNISLVNVRTKEYLKENVLQYAREKGRKVRYVWIFLLKPYLKNKRKNLKNILEMNNIQHY